jgi:hypothetical protein
MKNIILSILFICNFFFVNAQKTYTNKLEYERAVKEYNDKMDSYVNYVKKINFYKNYKYPKNTSYPNNWFVYFKTLLEKNDIKMDNYQIRYHKNIAPNDSIYVNFIDDDNSEFLSVTFTREPPFNYLHSAFIYKFNHPGKPPVLVDKPKKEIIVNKKVESKVVEIKPVTQDTITKTPELVAGIIENPNKDIFIMPDGKKYNYESLVVLYPSMKYDSVFRKNLNH